MSQKQIFWLEQVSPEDQGLTGDQAVLLGSLSRNYLPVPSGFVVTNAAYRHFLETDNLDQKIAQILSSLNAEDPEDKLVKSTEIKRLILSSRLPVELVSELFSYHKDLEPQGFLFKKPHQVKLSAHRQSSVVVSGEANLAEAIKDSWARQFDPQFVHELLDKPAAIIVQSDIPGEPIIFHSLDPETQDKSLIIVKKGTDRYEIKRASRGQIDSPVLNSQKIPREELNLMLDTFLELEKYHFFPLSADLKIHDGRVHIVDIRPLTFATSQEIEETKPQIIPPQEITTISGLPISPGRKTAPAKLAKDSYEAGRKLRHGEILIVEETKEDFLPTMKKASGIITKRGDRFSHAARFAKKRGIPSIIVNKDIPIKDGQVITINGQTGELSF